MGVQKAISKRKLAKPPTFLLCVNVAVNDFAKLTFYKTSVYKVLTLNYRSARDLNLSHLESQINKVFISKSVVYNFDLTFLDFLPQINFSTNLS